MDVKQNFKNGIAIISIDGQVDSTTAPILEETLKATLVNGNTQLVLDLTDVPYMSSAGLRVLSMICKDARKVGGDLRLACLSGTVGHAFRISGFDQILHIYESVDQALKDWGASQSM